ncbi:MarR family transcriptional regulator [Cupriavidus sp. BIS7]|uniref:MarR family winged helix-turn-helix transcriptional regulator n=1 Tax=Cupriavidus sp. BIS7 TaxID=1217718 RepID=UPI0003054A89|nr:MarR family transcriptional regulator [Cupriavidus sp. BIS7]
MAIQRKQKTVRAAAPDHATESETHTSPPIRIPYLIGRTDRVVKRRLTEALAPHGITLPLFTAMSVLQARGSLSNAQLAERSFISPQSANEIVKMMETKGWVVREPDPTHGRIVKLSLTANAEALLARCDETVKRLEAEMLEGIAPEHVALLQHLLTQCAKNLR